MFHYWKNSPHRCTILLAALLLLIIAFPLAVTHERDAPLFVVVMSVVMVGGVVAISDSRRHFYLAMALGLPAIATSWIEHTLEQPYLQAISPVTNALFFSLLIFLLLRYVLEARRVNRDVIAAAIAVYILIGLAFACTYDAIDRFETLTDASASFPNPSNHTIGSQMRLSILVYYSFVTMTTVGYGDIVPVSPLARSLAILEGICGVMFMAILIARLVSMYQPRRDAGDE